ncbi:MAG: hypothetical protein JW822_14135 [Spirochaetales bacterium]|nr:hypothetical protein [Spirochaetales bacterium]
MKIKYCIPIIIIFVLFFSCNQKYSKEQERHIEIYKQLTKYDFPSNSLIMDSYFVKYLDHTYYMIIKTNETYINKILKADPPFSDKWIEGPVPEEFQYGMYFGKNKNISSYGKGKAYGDDELIKLTNSKYIFYSTHGSMLEEPYKLNIFIIDKNDNTIYIGSYSM